MNKMGEDLERNWYKTGISRAALLFTWSKVHRIASESDKVREWSNGAKSNCIDAVNRVNTAVERNRAKVKKLRDNLVDSMGNNGRSRYQASGIPKGRG